MNWHGDEFEWNFFEEGDIFFEWLVGIIFILDMKITL